MYQPRCGEIRGSGMNLSTGCTSLTSLKRPATYQVQDGPLEVPTIPTSTLMQGSR